MKKVQFLDFRVSECKIANVFEEVERYSRRREALSVHFSAAHGFVEAHKSKILAEIFANEMVISDGKPLTFYLRLLGHKLEQIRGTAFMRKSLENKGLKGKHFFLGSTPVVLSNLISKVRESNPEIKIVGVYSPPVTSNIELLVEDSLPHIEKCKPDYVWVGLGAPKQFYVSSQLAQYYPAIFFSVGAAFEFLAGNRREAPKLVQKIGFEWLFRLLSNPVRLWRRYTIDNAKFMTLILKDILLRIRPKVMIH